MANLLAIARLFEYLFSNLQAPGPSRPGPNLTLRKKAVLWEWRIHFQVVKIIRIPRLVS